MKKIILHLFINLAITSFLIAQDIPVPTTNAQLSTNASSEIACDRLWEQAYYGAYIGNYNNVIPFDYGNDGSMEFIVNAMEPELNSSSIRHYVYVLKYNEITQAYDMIYISPNYDSQIVGLSLMDLNEDGIEEIVYGVRKNLYVLDPITLTETRIVRFEDFSMNYRSDLKYADADNDGEKELVISATNKLILIDPSNFETEQVVDVDFIRHFDVGNVDDDPELEVVMSLGNVLQINPTGEVIEEYSLLPFGGRGRIVLADVDPDQEGKEAVFANEDFISAYNVQTGIALYTINLEQEQYEGFQLHTLLLKDIDNDGIDELFYGNDRNVWNPKLLCFNGQTGELIWEEDSLESGVLGIGIADFDGDGALEIVWGASSHTEGRVFIYSLDNWQQEWESPLLEGAIYVVKVADVDEDGDPEIISMTEEDILTIYDANTKEIEYRILMHTMGNNYSDVRDFEIADYQNDGDLDIIMVRGENSSFSFWIYDGDTYELENFYHDFSYSLDGSRELEVIDIDDDQVLEFIIANNNHIYIINSLTSQVEWEWEDTDIPYPINVRDLIVANIDDDEDDEIILSSGYLYIFDPNSEGTYDITRTTDNEFEFIDLIDWNDDGLVDIISTVDDQVVQVLNQSFELIEEITELDGGYTGIHVVNIDGQGEEEIILTQSDRIVFFRKNDNALYSNHLGYKLGRYNSFNISDYNEDGQVDLLIGTNARLIELDLTCSECLFFEPELNITNPSCGEDNGVLLGENLLGDISYSVCSVGNTPPLNTIFTDTLSSLVAGDYVVLAENTFGCMNEVDISLHQEELIATTQITDKSCLGEDDGQASVQISQGKAPYTYQWSNNESSSTLSALTIGQYTLSLTDANDCVFTDTFNIEQAVLEVAVESAYGSCLSLNFGFADLEVLQGTTPFSYYWDGELGTANEENLAPKEYEVIVQDAAFCADTLIVQIDTFEYELNAVELAYTCNNEAEGVARVYTTPNSYQSYIQNIEWSTGESSFLIDNLSSGVYYVSGMSFEGCVAEDSVVITNHNLDADFYIKDISCFGATDGSIHFDNVIATPPFSLEWSTGQTTDTIENLAAATYFALLQDSFCMVVRDIEVLSPDPLNVSFNVSNDIIETTQADGAIEAVVSGGTAPYSYIWNTMDTESVITDLSVGEYFLTITDANACSIDSMAVIDLVSSTSELPADYLTIYPIPSADYINIKTNQISYVNLVDLLSINGVSHTNNIRVEKLNDTYILDVSSLLSGAYVLLFEVEGNYYHKLITVL